MVRQTKTEISERFITAVETILAEKNYTKTRVAESLGLNLSTFSMILGLRAHVGTDTVANFCVKYNFSAEWIMTGRVAMRKKYSLNRRQATSQAPVSQSDFPMLTGEIGQLFRKILHEKDQRIMEQSEEIGRLKAKIEESENGGGGNFKTLSLTPNRSNHIGLTKRRAQYFFDFPE